MLAIARFGRVESMYTHLLGDLLGLLSTLGGGGLLHFT
jgi:hypothetical protein